MMKNKLLYMFLLLITLATPAKAQLNLEVCNVVFNQGIRDNYFLLTEHQQFETYQHRLCDQRFSSYQAFRETSSGLNLSLPLAEGLLGLSGSDSQKAAQFSQNYQNFCTSTYFDTQLHQRYQSFISQVSTALTSSWNRCQELQLNTWLQANGIFAAITPFDNFREFLVEVRVRQSGSVPPLTITSIAPDNIVECFRANEKLLPNTVINTNQFEMTCRKNPALEIPFLLETSVGLTSRIMVPANTSKILELTRQMEDLSAEVNRSLQRVERAMLPVGSIVISTLSASEFQARFGDTPVRWVVCDGANHPNTEWARVSGNTNGTVPNLSGRYPRGSAAGLPNLGKTQEDATRNHRHQLPPAESLSANQWNIMKDAQGGGNNFVARIGVSSGGIATTTMIDGQPGEETRPKTTIVNFYIRVQ